MNLPDINRSSRLKTARAERKYSTSGNSIMSWKRWKRRTWVTFMKLNYVKIETKSISLDFYKVEYFLTTIIAIYIYISIIQITIIMNFVLLYTLIWGITHLYSGSVFSFNIRNSVLKLRTWIMTLRDDV